MHYPQRATEYFADLSERANMKVNDTFTYTIN